MPYQYLLFDVDGTLTDSGPGIVNSVIYALEKMGKPPATPEQLNQFIGPPLSDSFHRVMGIPKEQVSEAIRVYRYRYNELGGIFENSPYPDICALLERLRAEGKILLTATSKPLPMALRVLDHFDMTKYFHHIFGGTMQEGIGCTKAFVVRQAVEACGPDAAGKILMIGDRKHDVEGAHENGIPCAGILWGYGSREELEECGAEYIAADYEELLSIVNG